VDNYMKLNESLSMDIYKMKLNETLDLDMSTNIRRVAGGWIYTTTYEIENGSYISIATSSCFVPFNNEFMSQERT